MSAFFDAVLILIAVLLIIYYAGFIIYYWWGLAVALWEGRKERKRYE